MSQSQLAVGDLARVLLECAGPDEDSLPVGEDTIDVPFEELGYDSLGLLNTVGRLERDLQVRLGDEVARAKTPRLMLELINQAVAG
jgi:act minimal PKS acyl carrier protein